MRLKTQRVIITALGKDRPGIVAAVSKALYEAGCNLEDSSMTILEREFAMILVVALPRGVEARALDRKFGEARRKLGLSIFLKNLSRGQTRRARAAGEPYMISVYGVDRAGIVYRVTNLLARKKVNITDVNTKRTVEGSSPVYMMMLEVEIPKGLSPEGLKRELEKLASELSVTVTLHPIEAMTL